MGDWVRIVGLGAHGRWKSRPKGGRSRIDAQVQKLICDMVHRLWAADGSDNVPFSSHPLPLPPLG